MFFWKSRRPFMVALLFLVAAMLIPPTAHGQIFVTNYGSGNGATNGTIGAYSSSGSVINPTLVTGLDNAATLAVSGPDLFVVRSASGTVGEYTTAGATVNSSLISGLNDPNGIAISASNIFVANWYGGISKYTLSGVLVNYTFIGGFSHPWGVAVSGSDLFVTDLPNGTIGEYDADTGAVLNASLISGLDEPSALTVSGSDLFVTEQGKISEYTTSGATVNTSLVSVTGASCTSIWGSDLFVTDSLNGTIGEYDATTGAVVNAALVSGLNTPTGVVVVPAASPAPNPSSVVGGISLVGILISINVRRHIMKRNQD